MERETEVTPAIGILYVDNKLDSAAFCAVCCALQGHETVIYQTAAAAIAHIMSKTKEDLHLVIASHDLPSTKEGNNGGIEVAMEAVRAGIHRIIVQSAQPGLIDRGKLSDRVEICGRMSVRELHALAEQVSREIHEQRFPGSQPGQADN
jgi:hypothetical protein